MSVAEATHLRKAAIVVAALGAEAEKLLAQLPAELAASLRQEASAIELRGTAEELEVLREFVATWEQLRADAVASSRTVRGLSNTRTLARAAKPHLSTAAQATNGAEEVSSQAAVSRPPGKLGGYFPEEGSNLPREGLPRTSAKTSATAPTGTVPGGMRGDGRPFDSLRASGAAAIAQILAAERPQTVALVLSHLPPQQAGQVLTHFPPAQQVEIIHRLVDLEETDPEVLREIEKALEQRLAQIVQAGKRRRAGLAAVRTIVAAAERNVRGQILSNLEVFDRELARQLAPPLPQFEDLVLLDDVSLRALVQAAEPLVIQLALVGAPESLIWRVMALLPPQERNVLRSRLQELGPTALRDVDEARRRLCVLAQRLAMTGQLDLPQSLTNTAPRFVAQVA